MLFEASPKAPPKIGRPEVVKRSIDGRKVLQKKEKHDKEAVKATVKQENSPSGSPKVLKKQDIAKILAEKEILVMKERHTRLYRIKEVIKEFSGSLEKMNHPKM